MIIEKVNQTFDIELSMTFLHQFLERQGLG